MGVSNYHIWTADDEVHDSLRVLTSGQLLTSKLTNHFTYPKYKDIELAGSHFLSASTTPIVSTNTRHPTSEPRAARKLVDHTPMRLCRRSFYCCAVVRTRNGACRNEADFDIAPESDYEFAR